MIFLECACVTGDRSTRNPSEPRLTPHIQPTDMVLTPRAFLHSSEQASSKLSVLSPGMAYLASFQKPASKGTGQLKVSGFF